MGMSTHINAFIPDDDPEYIKHKKLALICEEADVSLPLETATYFGCNISGFYESLLDEKLKIQLTEGVHYNIFSDKSSEGFEVNINSLPKGVTKLRFYNSY